MSVGQPHHCELATPHILQLYQCCYQYSSQWTQTNLTTRPCPAVLNAWLSSAARRRRRCNSFSVSSSLRTAIGTASLPVPPGCSSTAYHTQVQLIAQAHNTITSTGWPNFGFGFSAKCGVFMTFGQDFRLLAWLSYSAFSELHSVAAKCNCKCEGNSVMWQSTGDSVSSVTAVCRSVGQSNALFQTSLASPPQVPSVINFVWSYDWSLHSAAGCLQI